MKASTFRRISKLIGLTAAELAAALGVTVQTINNYSSGRSPVAGPVALIMHWADEDNATRGKLRGLVPP